MHFAHTISSRSSIALPKGCIVKTIDSRLIFGLRLLSVLDLVYELAVKLVPGGFCLKAPGLDDCAPPSSGLQHGCADQTIRFRCLCYGMPFVLRKSKTSEAYDGRGSAHSLVYTAYQVHCNITGYFLLCAGIVIETGKMYEGKSSGFRGVDESAKEESCFALCLTRNTPMFPYYQSRKKPQFRGINISDFTLTAKTVWSYVSGPLLTIL